MKVTPTIPNLLTLFRILLTPFILYFVITDNLFNIIMALLLYIISAVTDTMDGILARKLNQMSEFGAFFDPIADKILIWSIFTIFSLKPGLFIPLWLIVIIYLRDLFITMLRGYSKRKNIYFKTSFKAKAKTSIQMIVAGLIMGYILFTLLFKSIYKIASNDYSEIWRSIMGGFSTFFVMIPLMLTLLTIVITIYTAVDYYITFKKNQVMNNDE